MDNKLTNEQKTSKEVELKDLFLLTISQAAKLFNLGPRTIRGLVASHPKGDWFLKNGNRIMIKKDRFGEFLNRQSRI